MSEPRALEFMRALWALDHALHRTSKRMAVELGVTGPQRLVIRLLGRNRVMTAGELARAMHVHPSTLTGVLRRLERSRLVTRDTDADDRRQTRLALTPHGRRLDARLGGTIEAAIVRTLGRVTTKEAEGARQLLSALTAALHRTADAPVNGRAARHRTR